MGRDHGGSYDALCPINGAFKPFLIIITAAVIYFSSKCPWLPEKLMVSMPATRGPLKASGCGQRSNIFT
jgi:hypothetical protein